ncbi:hypothetical protein TNCT_477971 [Trichonephila clavata]|uniref:Uncharacterized protein n=1 Tax=Trichonephila clavata TaxID=2740835 RepID=A0A8X6LPW8_TRICU|nr:hypothetical protein TNCT_477971 [Trichonephila clavata]
MSGIVIRQSTVRIGISKQTNSEGEKITKCQERMHFSFCPRGAEHRRREEQSPWRRINKWSEREVRSEKRAHKTCYRVRSSRDDE